MKVPRWLGAALLAAVLYLVASIVSADLAGRATSEAWRFAWRLSAFVVSAVVLAIHVRHELRNGRRPGAAVRHATVGAGLGGFAIALAANVHELGSATGFRPRMLIALVAWPLITALPAFVVALLVAAVLGKGHRAPA